MVTRPPDDSESLRTRVIEAVERHPHVARVALVGSRAEGRAHELSDWDFAVETDNFSSVAGEMAALCAPLAPLAQQWDRLSSSWCWMLLLAGPVKVDLIFSEPHAAEPPWQPDAANLDAIDAHFWDWILWLHSKQAAHKRGLVAAELQKMSDHILAPMGASVVPRSVDEAILAYRSARSTLERRFAATVPRTVENAVYPAITGTAPDHL